MILFNWPFSARYPHKTALGWIKLKYYKIMRKPRDHTGKLNFIYFSYSPDYEYLTLSIRTLLKYTPQEYLGKIFVAEDQKAPFNEEQKQKIFYLYNDIEITPIFNFSWGSIKSTFAEIELFKNISKTLKSKDDLIIKIDSDILVFETKKLIDLCNTNLPAIGDGHYLQFKHAQGGLYALRKSTIENILGDITIKDVERASAETGSVAEDVCISHILKSNNTPFFHTRLMLFPDEYKKINTLNWLVKREFNAIHCHKDKENMALIAKNFDII